MAPRHILMALLVVAIWGFNFVVIKLSVAALPPLFSVALRFFFAAVPAVFFVRPPKAPVLLVVGYGFAFGVALYTFLNLALAIGMPAGLGSLVLQVQALFTMFFAYLWLNDRPRPQQVLGAAVAFAGIGVIAAGEIEGGLLLPLGLTVLAAIAWGVANILTKRAGPVNPVALTVWGALVVPLPMLMLSFIFEGPQAIADAVVGFTWGDAALIAFLAYPATLLGLAIWSGLLSRYPASTVAPFTLLVPVTGLLSGVLILGDQIGMPEIAGGVLILLGLALVALRLKAAPHDVAEPGRRA